jgi:hypothetical protein
MSAGEPSFTSFSQDLHTRFVPGLNSKIARDLIIQPLSTLDQALPFLGVLKNP